MSTLEKIAWLAITITLIVAVSSVIIQPIYDKAKEQQQEIEEIEFDDPTAYAPFEFKIEAEKVVIYV